ncbi:MAG: hypothetical protein J6Q16_03655 [Clostridia bacterium]|nr:hypothetical protein [Clostridia bacterium]
MRLTINAPITITIFFYPLLICRFGFTAAGVFLFLLFAVDVIDLFVVLQRIHKLCADAGVVLTNAGATYPYGIDPEDKNIRIAPSLPPVEELRAAMEVFCICTKRAAVEKLLEK